VSEHVRTSLGDTIAFDRYGGTGPGVLFVAGAGVWRGVDPVTPHTAQLLTQQGFSAIVYDRPGRGRSRLTDPPFTLEREVAALEALLAELPEPTVLCGHSSGAAISLYALSRGVQVARLVLWECPLSPDEGQTAEWAGEFGRLLDNRDLSAAASFFLRDVPPRLVERVRARAEYPVIVEQMDSQRPDADALAWAKSGTPAGFHASLDIPVLLLVGEQSYEQVVTAAEWLADALPRGRWKRIPGARHNWEPAAMARELAQFLESLPA
jgi:pimeloyl-ACP methyl ester carboxylesterase